MTPVSILKIIEPLPFDEFRTEFKTYRHVVKRLENWRSAIGQLQVTETFMPRRIQTRASPTRF